VYRNLDWNGIVRVLPLFANSRHRCERASPQKKRSFAASHLLPPFSPNVSLEITPPRCIAPRLGFLSCDYLGDSGLQSRPCGVA
jgi:hypothetical protein